MKMLLSYICRRRAAIVAIIIFLSIFAASFALFRLPLEAVAYPAALCAVIGFGFCVYDFIRVRRKYRLLMELSQLTAGMITSLPEVRSFDDEGYQAIITSLKEEILELESTASAKYRDMTEYYTVWAHQIKTPISAMRLTLQNEDTPMSRKLSTDLFRIEQYVGMVLAFLRLDSPTSDYVFKEYNLDTIIRQAIRNYAPEFIDRKLSLEYEPSDGTVVTDEKWLQFAVEQILSNALKYTREGSIRIYVEKPKTLCIKDTGIGIAPEDLPRIFEKGYTGYNGRRDKRASGLGLYLCKRICDNLGIGISVTSELDKGTTVYINLEQYKLIRE